MQRALETAFEYYRDAKRRRSLGRVEKAKLAPTYCAATVAFVLFNNRKEENKGLSISGTNTMTWWKGSALLSRTLVRGRKAGRRMQQP